MIKAIAIDDEQLALDIIQAHCSQHKMIELVGTFNKPFEAEKYLKNFPADLVFLDINMPSISGINLAKSLQQEAMIIFTTAYSEFAAESYELNAIDYLLKPINRERFNTAVQKAIDYYQYANSVSTEKEKHLFVRADLKLHKIAFSEVLLVEGVADYLKIHLQDKKPIVARMTMKEMVTKLPENDFIRVNRSYIIPVSRIQSVTSKTIFLPEKEIPIGSTYLKPFFERFTP
jgi:DNA-binding LytR/AlgR family response regulator